MSKQGNEFWKNKKLNQLSKEQWESLCDHCGKCCLEKLKFRNQTLFMNLCCQHLDLTSGGCKVYNQRLKNMYCVEVNLKTVMDHPELLPDTCAYKRLVNNQDLPDWHPLISGKIESVREAGESVQCVGW